MSYKIEKLKGGGLKIITEVKHNDQTVYIGSWNLKGDGEKLLKEHEERLKNKEVLIAEWNAARTNAFGKD